ncbi:hypothetical protein LS73_008095 [Helicobacter muridarum]|uniref:Outer membrane protein n=1 Tax=Helicobacter muridarum TaxID=216 RepID=A0A377PX37_9HELI|nr:hypothetical protein [Helicobacter muridarum]TLD98906.1 hypothetical protein LS73_008095 [Helicobacter muridarum]STQ87127.1 outer membrane protein [Helicobacter muridarum]
MLLTRYIRIIFFALSPILIGGCVTVKLKSVLPQQAYYNLDNIKLNPSCKNMDTAFGISISVLSPYDGKDILVYDKKSEITILENYKWIDLPKNMIRNNFIKAGLNACIQIDQNPPVSQKLNTLQIYINEMYVELDSENQSYTGYMYLHYELRRFDYERIKNGIIITQSKDTNPIKALQDATNESLQKVLTQIKQ